MSEEKDIHGVEPALTPVEHAPNCESRKRYIGHTCGKCNCGAQKTTPVTSKSEYKRVKALGGNPVLPSESKQESWREEPFWVWVTTSEEVKKMQPKYGLLDVFGWWAQLAEAYAARKVAIDKDKLATEITEALINRIPDVHAIYAEAIKREVLREINKAEGQ